MKVADESCNPTSHAQSHAVSIPVLEEAARRWLAVVEELLHFLVNIVQNERILQRRRQSLHVARKVEPECLLEQWRDIKCTYNIQ